MSSLSLTMVLIIFLLCSLQVLVAKSIHKDKETCKERLCKASVGYKGNECYCCTNCALYNRQKGDDCPTSPDKCGLCLLGYEFIPSIKYHCRLAFVPNHPNATLNVTKDERNKGDNGGSDDGKAPSGGGSNEGLIIATVVVVVAAAAVVTSLAVRQFKENHRGQILFWGKRSPLPSRQNSGTSLDGQDIEMIPLKNGTTTCERDNLAENFPEEMATLLRMPVEDGEEQPTADVHLYDGDEQPAADVHLYVRQTSENLQKAIPINFDEAQLNSAQTIVHNEPEENDEAVAHFPSAPPAPIPFTQPTLPDSNSFDVNNAQPDSGFHTHADSDDAASIVSSYSNATTARVGESTPQGSPSSDQMEEDNDADGKTSSPTFPAGYTQNTPTAEGVCFSVEFIARASVNIPNP